MNRIVIALVLVAAGCNKAPSEAPSNAPTAANETPVAATPTRAAAASPTRPNAVAGISWTIPAAWKTEGPRQMRVATYVLPKQGDDPEDGSIAVYHFGAQGGGGIEANITRWYGQMKAPEGKTVAEIAKRDSFAAGSVKITRVDVSGTYLFSARPMAPNKTEKPNYRMVGAIAEGPGGLVFFKLTAPAATAAAAVADFETMLKSITPG